MNAGETSTYGLSDDRRKFRKNGGNFSGMPIQSTTSESDFEQPEEEPQNSLKNFENLGKRSIQKKSEPNGNVAQVAANAIGGKFKRIDESKQIDSSYKTVNTQRLEGKSLDVEMKVLQKQSPEPEQNQNDGQPKPQQKDEQPDIQQPNGQQKTDETGKTDETSKTSKIEDKKEANNDDDSGINMAEFFRAKENIDAHIETKGKGDGLDDALVKCLSKTPGVRIIRKGIFGRFGEPAAIKYCGVTMSFHKGHVVASGEGNVREIVQDLLTKIKPTDTASDNSERKDAEVNPETGELTVGGCKYIFPVPRKDVIVLIQNSDGDSAFAPDELKKPTSLTYKAANQLMALNKDKAFRQRYFPGIEVNFAESITQMKSNSTDPERSKNNVYPFARKMFNAVSERLNVVSSWVDNSTNDILQQELKIANPDLLLNIYDAMYEQCAQEEEAALDQQNQARDINERAKEIAGRTINEYNLLSSQKLEESSKIAVMAFLEKLHQGNPRILDLEPSFANSDSGIGPTREDMERTIARTKNAIMRDALEEARKVRNAPNDFSGSDDNGFASIEDNDLNFDDNPLSEIDNDNDNKSDQSANSNRNEIASESTDEDDSENLNAKSSDGATAGYDSDSVHYNPFSENDF